MKTVLSGLRKTRCGCWTARSRAAKLRPMKAPKSADYCCDECGSHFESLKSYLQALNITYVLNPRLVRVLNYYTKTVFGNPAAGVRRVAKRHGRWWPL